VLKEERQDVITAAHLTLGYIYYELGFFRQAIKHFSSIPQDNEVYKEAMLAKSWAAIKLDDYQQSIITLNELIKVSDEDKYTEEAHFLLGQCYLELGFYDFAINEFDIIIERFPGKNNIGDRILEVERGMLEQRKMAEQLRIDLLLLESKLLDLIPLDRLSKKSTIPKYIEEEKRKIDETRDNIIQLILQERKQFDEFHWSVKDLQDEIARKSSRKHWRAYAEYGKARSFFLKTMPGK
jgi:tetratricopeptide (TPR) repeat protein